jgi:hypothetical protein
VLYTVIAKSTNTLTLDKALATARLPTNGHGVFRADFQSIYAAYAAEDEGLYGWIPGTVPMMQILSKPRPDRSTTVKQLTVNTGLSLAAAQAIARLQRVNVN